MSSTTAWTRCSRAAARASCPSPATSTPKPAARRTAGRHARKLSSSSTTRIAPPQGRELVTALPLSPCPSGCTGAGTKLQAGGGAHHVDRRLQAGPARERRGALTHQHLEAVDDRRAAGPPGGGDQRCVRAVRVVREVDDRELGPELDEHRVLH